MSARGTPDFSPYHHNNHVPDPRAMARRAEEERVHLRRRELELQTSASCSPEERIRTWERLHALHLPASALHPLVSVIATATQLSIRAVREEQQRRGTSSGPRGLGSTNT